MATRPRSSIPAPARPTWRLHASSCRRGCWMKKRKLPPPRLRRRLRNDARSAAAAIIQLADPEAVGTPGVVGSRGGEGEIGQVHGHVATLYGDVQTAATPGQQEREVG